MRIFICLFFLLFVNTVALSNPMLHVPILVYHNLDPVVPGSMTISTVRFEQQLQWLKDNHYTVIPLRELVSYLQGKISALPKKSIVITDDDGRKSVYQYMLPIVSRYHIPVTLFIYPAVISRARYALTWEQLKELQHTQLFDIESHTYSHPNFKQMKKHLSDEKYQRFLYSELTRSKKILAEKVGTSVTLLAWPFGIHNQEVEQMAEKSGYAMAFTIGYYCASRGDNAMTVPRHMIIASQTEKTFEAIVRCQMRK